MSFSRPPARRPTVPALVLASLLGTATLAGAASAGAAPGDAALAETLWAKGRHAMARGDLASACPLFTRSLELDPAVGTLLNLATCEEKAGRLVAAQAHYASALTQLAEDDFRLEYAAARLAVLAKRVARVVLVLPSPAPRDLHVLQDGRELPARAWSAPIAVDPGPHVFEVRSGSTLVGRLETTMHEGDEKRLVVDGSEGGTTGPTQRRDGDRAKSAAAPTATEPREEARGGRTAAGVAALSVGAAGVVTGAITGLLTMSAARTVRERCVQGACDAEGLTAADTGRTMSMVSPVAFAVGVVGLGVGSALFLTAPKAAPRVGVAPLLSPTTAGVTLVRSF